MLKTELDVSLLDLTLTISNAIDLISPVLNNHHKQVAYIAYNIGKELELSNKNCNELLIASLLHDIGCLNLGDRISALQFENENAYQHAVTGYFLLKDVEELESVGKIIKYHHLYWMNGAGRYYKGEPVPIESHIIHLADRISVSILQQNEIIAQVDRISKVIEKSRNTMFHPELIDIFNKLKAKESFWFDIISPSIDRKFKKMWGDCGQQLDLEKLDQITKIFARIIDFRSTFTSIHSSGVAAIAEALAKKLNWSEEGCKKIKIAGYLHDLGKLAISNEILEKPSRLTVEEYNTIKSHTYHGYYLLEEINGLQEINTYASYHHERLDGTGYPFHIGEDALGEGARIMAVADVFTAITEDRPYRKGMLPYRVIEVLENMAKSFALDEKIVEIIKIHFEEMSTIRAAAQKQAYIAYKDFSEAVARAGGKYYE
ncbi:HD-GYP domain-containing protein [Clostridium formicaceticum]|uniref:Cyclic di-GMP phosphodiesterase response regulator RpfG n=1 Tax=Clostridium formicaceticum TaxID=1497 RepID=A0AAC9RIQ2_9CLOT|nr:HD domain-containing phosphohydrolase [Clostridium formicaceticum]AOY76393.1 hypothetical protein BJL90_11040 [Clostridium formicaceticum]ARE86786.1 Cyclic di-GMP phosphodiesterase response regulator RpfG [Clostridium formicaceticum]